MGVNVTAPNNGSDYLNFNNVAGTNLAKIGGYDDGTSNGHLEFYTTAGGTSTERARLDSSGNLGLGVTPSAWQSAQRAIEFGYAGSSLAANNTNGNINFSINRYINTSGTNTYANNGYAASYQLINDGSHRWLTAPSGTAGAAIAFTQAMTLANVGNYSTLAINAANGSDINFQAGGATVSSIAMDSSAGASPVLMFRCGSSNTERMRIDSNGNLLVGTTTSGIPGQWGAQGITVAGNFSSTGGMAVRSSSGTGTQYFIGFGRNGNELCGNIQSNGTNSTSYNTSSDYRLKENIQPMQNALAVVQQLNPVTYTWKADGSDGQGFIAHELQAVVPDCVSGEKDAVREVDVLDDEGRKIGTKEEPVYQGIDTSFLVATLTKAIQELKEELDEAKTRITELEAK